MEYKIGTFRLGRKGHWARFQGPEGVISDLSCRGSRCRNYVARGTKSSQRLALAETAVYISGLGELLPATRVEFTG